MIILYWVLIAVMIVGVIGAVVPGIPGSSLILGSIIIWAIAQGFGTVGWALGVAIVVLLLSVSIDLLATYFGAKRGGASKWGQIGAIVGFLLGFLGLLPALPIGGPLLGILLGPLLGAIIGEYLYRKDLTIAVKAGIAVVVSSVIGNFIQGILALAVVIFFVATTWPPPGLGL
ncbi:DUF456 domain-containing protein [Laspinema olomoucense]|uniref:DUF456 domain-containing protein n=1 Tax=Laspinema olomoucense TaxID=3231600 RepID=UPI0021BB4BBB|nr:DUF456 family protein [Laspinema sp. D3c]MCT7997141.1 DUF456 family protein [Laspinema sp. D3c]